MVCDDAKVVERPRIRHGDYCKFLKSDENHDYEFSSVSNYIFDREVVIEWRNMIIVDQINVSNKLKY